jgi:UDP-GlcNAc3NAcA epimerase
LKILTILGARPQFIKAGSVSREIMEHNQSLAAVFSFLERENQKLITEVIVHTGQHYDANSQMCFLMR